MNTFTLGVRNAFRNTIRSLSIVTILGLSIGLSLVMLIAHQAVGAKIKEVKQSVGNTVSITPAGFSNFSQANNALTTSDLSKVKSLAHVSALDESLGDHLATEGSASFGPMGDSSSTTNLKSPVKLGGDGKGGGLMLRTENGQVPSNFSPPIEVTGTTDTTKIDSSGITLKSGTSLDGSKDVDEALVSSDMASKNSLKVGSTFTAYGKTLKVAGIFSSSTQKGNNTIILTLPTLQRLSEQGSNVTSAVATVDSLDNLSGTTSAIKSALGSKADVQSAQDEADDTVKPLQNIKSVSLYSLVGAVIAGSVIILLTMIMIVRERRREIGILKAIGASNTRIIFQFMSEALTLTILGAVIGLIIGVAGSGPVTNTLVSNSTGANDTAQVNGPDGKRFGGPSGPMTVQNNGGGNSGFVSRRFGSGSRTIGRNIRDIHTQVGWSTLVYGFAAALFIAVIGSASAGWLIARVRPSEVMRAE